MPCPFLEDDLFEDDDTTETEQEKNMLQVIDGLRSLNFYDKQLETIENTKTFPSKVAQYGEIELSKEITLALKERGIEQLYIHQTEALLGLFDHQHVIVSTSTAR